MEIRLRRRSFSADQRTRHVLPKRFCGKAEKLSDLDLFRGNNLWREQARSSSENVKLENLEGKWDPSSSFRLPPSSFEAYTDRNDTNSQTKNKVLVAEVSIKHPWEILAHFKYGDWNECPPAEEHCALWQYWNSMYEAHIVYVTHNVVEAKVLKPPTTQQKATELAWEYYSYCPDIVHQDMETVSNLAVSLLNRKSWSFWWD